MENIKQIEREIKYIGYYQIIGGILGIGFIIGQAFSYIRLGPIGIDYLIISMLLCLPFAFSIYAGIRCIKNKSNKFLISKINQGLQILSFSFGGFGILYFSGFYVAVGIDTKDAFNFISNFGLSAVDIEINTGSNNSFLIINLVAFYLF